MTLKKQSIRKTMHITVDGEELSKDELITLSEGWNEKQENFFKKMLKQGGHFRLQGKKFIVSLEQRADLDSNGDKPVNLPPIPGERSF